MRTAVFHVRPRTPLNRLLRQPSPTVAGLATTAVLSTFATDHWNCRVTIGRSWKSCARPGRRSSQKRDALRRLEQMQNPGKAQDLCITGRAFVSHAGWSSSASGAREEYISQHTFKPQGLTVSSNTIRNNMPLTARPTAPPLEAVNDTDSHDRLIFASRRTRRRHGRCIVERSTGVRADNMLENALYIEFGALTEILRKH